VAFARATVALADDEKESVRVTRRDLVTVGVALATTACGPVTAKQPHVPIGPPVAVVHGASDVDIAIELNGEKRSLRLEPRVTLLDALRERLALPGTKMGCDMGQCGACTVLVDDRRVLSCLTLAAMCDGKKVQTIEGLATGDTLHAVQAAFAREDAFQCGFCTPGQIMSAVGLIREGHAKGDDEVREAMSGNICRCGAYPNIVRAVQRARNGS
jgi:xanthine dehydrogenase YagT iron-sulfur-binding subunit